MHRYYITVSRVAVDILRDQHHTIRQSCLEPNNKLLIDLRLSSSVISDHKLSSISVVNHQLVACNRNTVCLSHQLPLNHDLCLRALLLYLNRSARLSWQLTHRNSDLLRLIRVTELIEDSYHKPISCACDESIKCCDRC